jgi:hypothetical protein
MKIEAFSAVGSQDVVDPFVFDGELELVRLDRRCGPAPVSFLDQFPFISFENIPFSYGEIEVPAFYSISKNKIETEVNEYDQTHYEKGKKDAAKPSQSGRFSWPGRR